MHSRTHDLLTHPLAASSLASWQPGLATSDREYPTSYAPITTFRDFSVFSPQKLFGGLAPIWVWRWKLHFLPYHLVKVSWKSVQPFPRTVVS